MNGGMLRVSVCNPGQVPDSPVFLLLFFSSSFFSFFFLLSDPGVFLAVWTQVAHIIVFAVKNKRGICYWSVKLLEITESAILPLPPIFQKHNKTLTDILIHTFFLCSVALIVRALSENWL